MMNEAGLLAGLGRAAVFPPSTDISGRRFSCCEQPACPCRWLAAFTHAVDSIMAATITHSLRN
jgi:hypothetical protein